MDVLNHVTSRETAMQALAWCINTGEGDALDVLMQTHFKDVKLTELVEDLDSHLLHSTKSGKVSACVFRTILKYVDDTYLHEMVAGEKTFVSKLLGHAVEQGNEDMVRTLSKRGADLNCLYKGKPLLHLALELGHADVTKRLVLSGCDVTQRDRRGDGVLAATICSPIQDKGEMVQWLIGKGADVTATLSSGKCLLHIAAAHSVDVIDVLVNLGGDVNVTDYVNEDTPLHVACANCCQETILKLVQCGASFNKRNKAGETPLEKLLKFAKDPHSFHSKSRVAVAKRLLYIGFRILPKDNVHVSVSRKGRDKVSDLYASLLRACPASSLQSLCRPVIRELVKGPGFEKKTTSLDIPSNLKTFLRFDDGSLQFPPKK